MIDSGNAEYHSSDQGISSNQRLVPRSHEEWKKHQCLKRAICHGQKEEAKRLIQEGVHVNVSSELSSDSYYRVTPLHLAVQLGCLDLVESLLYKGASVKALDMNHESPLSLSVRLRRYSITDLLLTADSLDKCRCRDTNLSHLQIACMRNNIAAVRKLIRLGSEINEQVGQKALYFAGYTALHFAVENHATEIVQLLVDNGASIVKKNSLSMTPLHLAHEVRDEGIIDILLSAHMYEPGNPKDGCKISHFHIACTRNHVNFVKFFLQQKVDVNSPIFERENRWANYEPLRFAIYYDCPDTVEVLLLHGAKLRTYSPEDEEVYLDLAYSIGNEKIINLLLSRMSISSTNNLKNTKLSKFQLACVRGDVEKMEEILSRAQQVLAPELDSPLSSGCTPLHFLVKNLPTPTNVMKKIRELGGNMSVKDAKGRTPLHILFERYPTCIKELGLFNFEQNPVDQSSLSHFHIACATNKINLIEKFLEHGADVNCTVDSSSLRWPGWSPLHFAVQFQHSGIVDILLKHGAKILAENETFVPVFDLAIMKFKSDSWCDSRQGELEIVRRMLLERQKSSVDFDTRGFSLLHLLCSTREDFDIVKLSTYADLLQDGINQTIDFPSSKYHQYTPLHFAMDANNGKIIQWLIEKGADVHLVDCNGLSPLQHEFEAKGRHGILKKNPELLRVPGNPFDTQGYSYFHISCILNDQDAMNYYINSGVDVNLPKKIDIDGGYDADTPLTSVLRTADDDINMLDSVKFLIRHGANVKACNAYLNTPLHYMNGYFSRELIELLINRGADVNARNIFGETPLSCLCKNFETSKKIILLLEHGADINIENDRRQTPLSHPCEALMITGFSSGKILSTLLKHVKKLLVAGIQVSNRNQKIYDKFFEIYSIPSHDELKFEEKCDKEIQSLKNVRINKYTTLHNVVFKTPNEMTYLSQNALFRELIDSDRVASDFPIYGYLIKLQYKKGLTRKPLLEQCKKSLHSLAKFSAEYAEKILDYLDDIDLENIIKSES